MQHCADYEEESILKQSHAHNIVTKTMLAEGCTVISLGDLQTQIPQGDNSMQEK